MDNERDAGIPSPAQQPGTHAPWRESPTQQQNRLQHVACRRFEVKGNTGRPGAGKRQNGTRSTNPAAGCRSAALVFRAVFLERTDVGHFVLIV